ncbi:MAG: DNA recombination protein RmuC [Proteobacteria bacterium]|nr:DNA recombination protein RmuC [Pseudomonadota bacterium]
MDGTQLLAELRVVSGSMQIQQASVEMLERRLSQLHGQVGADSADLRENLIDRVDSTKQAITAQLGEDRSRSIEAIGALREQLRVSLVEHERKFEQRHANAAQALNSAMNSGFKSLHEQLGTSLLRNATTLGQRLESLTRTTDERLREIGGQVDRRLAEGFEKTTSTFADVLRRLALIDEAQKKITELSGEVVNLNHILADKRSRGAFGEVQLAALVSNVLPASNFGLQYALPNERIADCVLHLPAPTGNLAIDSKFPLESYRRMSDFDTNEHDRKLAQRQFKQDIRKHIRDIADKYIIPGTTTDGAMMFIPAEAIFAEIQAHHYDLVDEAHAAHVWIVSPTTLWAILNTVSSVLKDAATREQIDIIQEHLGLLGKDFLRFRERMDQLARHISQAHDDVRLVHTSARKISDRFARIERVELDLDEDAPSQLQNTD